MNDFELYQFSVAFFSWYRILAKEEPARVPCGDRSLELALYDAHQARPSRLHFADGVLGKKCIELQDLFSLGVAAGILAYESDGMGFGSYRILISPRAARHFVTEKDVPDVKPLVEDVLALLGRNA
ncbi:MAG TPA: hypothetical protein VLJ21_05145 [Candidatus Binatia bacterium]|nr:hypothetical protein [Candidatus Binatia bacterium]